MGVGGNRVPTRGSLGGRQQNQLIACAQWDPIPDIDAHHTPLGMTVRPWALQCASPPGAAKRWQAAARKVFPLLDPCLHCRIFTRGREEGKFMG